MKKLTFNMDSRWEGYVNEYTQEIFEKHSKELTHTHNKVPDPIKRHLKRVESLILLRSVDYELQDVAEFYCYTILEWSLRDIYFKVEGKRKENLHPLLTWASQNKLSKLTESNIKFICDCRNSFAHLNRAESLHGTMASSMIQILVDLINELYQ